MKGTADGNCNIVLKNPQGDGQYLRFKSNAARLFYKSAGGRWTAPHGFRLRPYFIRKRERPACKIEPAANFPSLYLPFLLSYVPLPFLLFYAKRAGK